MMNTKLSYNKMDGRLAFHAVQSFKPGEVTPEQCHALGVQLAKQMWGNRFEVVVSTHLDKDHLHNHLIFNSVSFVDYKKYHSNKQSYYHIRRTSDRICKEHKVKILYFISMKKNRLWSRKFSCHFNGGFEITIKTAVFFCKNENTEGVLKSPFFKDTVVSRRYCHVLFYVPCGAYLCLGRNTVKHSN